MRPDSPLFHAKHVFRALILFLLGVVALIVVRSLLVPPSWGAYGHYRGDSPAEYSALPVSYQGPASCAACHDEESKARDAGVHHTVSCEVCHAPLARHVKDGDVIAEMPVAKTDALCLRCHLELDARPATFPQVQPRKHIEEQGGTDGPTACFDCHNPHSPL